MFPTPRSASWSLVAGDSASTCSGWGACCARWGANWDVVREPEAIRSGRTLIFPDFMLCHRLQPERRVLVEIVASGPRSTWPQSWPACARPSCSTSSCASTPIAAVPRKIAAGDIRAAVSPSGGCRGGARRRRHVCLRFAGELIDLIWTKSNRRHGDRRCGMSDLCASGRFLDRQNLVSNTGKVRFSIRQMLDESTLRMGSALRERRRVLLLCAPVMLLLTFAEVAALKRFSPAVFRVRLLWAAHWRRPAAAGPPARRGGA